ncbi:hypothetical protein EIN_327980 [Entamoeba invadens IP1]|uniref:F-box domain-containing protein n=1 Tax=Entamoeba invadens IP1 TaxID=370355 RepID=A0A0A1U3G0_ENTIV|nr:hypothetical protein EIN_327980 [Entamoeba invadens IP1]ELP86141.1 hypothetical protein EIN_327980 [Entamoeba invadens IP1]|eukprot:XP_004185487.1 hypothetical protein EIN_327980 [Entamoeba invadens IP1]
MTTSSTENFEDVIRLFLSDQPTEEKGWEKVENVLNPPIFFLQLFKKRKDNVTLIQISSLLHHNFPTVAAVMKDVIKLLGFDLLIKKVVPISQDTLRTTIKNTFEDEYEVTSKYHFRIQLGTVIFVQKCFSNNKIRFIQIHCCEKQQRGVKYTIYNMMYRPMLSQEIDFFFGNYSYFVNNLNDYLSGNEEGWMISKNIKNFVSTMNEKITFPNTIYQNEIFHIYANANYSELIIVGQERFPLLPFGEICSRWSKYIESNMLLPVIRELMHTERLRLFHKSVPFISHVNATTDILYGSVIVERGMFLFGKTENSESCPCAPKCDHEHFSNIFSGDMVHWIGNCAQTDFFYHYSTPCFANLDKQILEVYLKNFIGSFVLSRAVLHHGISMKISPSRLSPFQYSKILLSNTVDLVRVFKEQRKTKYTLKRQEKILFPPLKLLELPPNVTEHIFDFLPLESLLCVSASCKTLRTQILANDERFKMFFDLHMNAATFFRRRERVLDVQRITPEVSYYKAVCQAKTTQSKWINKLLTAPKSMKIFSSPVNNIFVTNSRKVVAVSIKEKKCVSYSKDFEKRFTFKGSDKIRCTNFNHEKNTFQFVCDNYLFYRFSIDGGDFTKVQIPKYQNISCMSRDCIVGNLNLNVSIFDLNVAKVIETFQPDLTGICGVDEGDNGLIITLGKSGRLVGYDRRAKRNAFTTFRHKYKPLLFDTFGDYLVYACDNGNIEMYDERKHDVCSQRTFNGAITALRVGNRRVVLSTNRNSVVHLKCFNGWFGTNQTIYQSPSSVSALLINELTVYVGSEDGTLVRLM